MGSAMSAIASLEAKVALAEMFPEIPSVHIEAALVQGNYDVHLAIEQLVSLGPSQVCGSKGWT